MFLGRPTLRSVPEIEGKGTDTEPYLIPDLATLEQLCNGVNPGRDYSGVYFTLTADIDMSVTYGQFLFKSWTPIGSAVNQFKGTFDGGGHKITGLYTNGKTGFRGLFGYLGRGGVIKNLGVESDVKSNITSGVSTITKKGLTACHISGAMVSVFTKSRAKSDREVPFWWNENQKNTTMPRTASTTKILRIIEPILSTPRSKYSAGLQRVAGRTKEKQTWNCFQICRWWSTADSNRSPRHCQCRALAR